MIKKGLHIGLSAWLSILLLFGSTSKEFIHLFADHEDTVHCSSSHTDGLVIEPEHHHCTFLQFSLTPFVSDHFTFNIAVAKTVYIVQYFEAVQHLIPRTTVSALLRGPPASGIA